MWGAFEGGSVSCTACGHPTCGAPLLRKLRGGADRREHRTRAASGVGAVQRRSGYTTLSEVLDAEDVRTVVNEVSTRAAGIVVGYGGRVEKVMGDSILAVFGDPVAREDDAERAVRAALTIHEVVAEVGLRNVGLRSGALDALRDQHGRRGDR